MTRRFDPFQVLSEKERSEELEALESHFELRDGAFDLHRRTLSRREERLRDIERRRPLWTGPFDREAFKSHFEGRSGPPLDPRTVWLLTLARSNQAESYGAEQDAGLLESRGGAGRTPGEIRVLLEEQVHGRILREACRSFGIDVRPQPPGRVMRLLIRAMQRLPGPLRFVPTLCGEVIGTIVFRRLLETSYLFADQPDVERRLRALIGEVLSDEVSHVLYCRARLGPVCMRIARALRPVLARGFLTIVPELRQLGLDRRTLMRRLAEHVDLPQGLDRLGQEPSAWRGPGGVASERRVS